MNKAQGTKGTPYLECTNPTLMKWRVRWDFVDLPPDPEIGSNMVEFWEEEYIGQISMNVIKSIVLHGKNYLIDERIKSGFSWKDMAVWLSTENQMNYKAAYDYAYQTGGANLPITFKFGSEFEPIYYRFTELSDLQDFFSSALMYIQATLEAGWAEKDAIDWTVYEEELPA